MKNFVSKVAATAFVVVSVISSAAPLAAIADIPGVHPDYVQALSDLRMAKEYLARPDSAHAQAEEISAMEELDFCLRDLNACAVVDGKNPAAAPVVDAGFKGNRIMRALELMGKASTTLSSREDDAAVLKARQSAARHLDVAVNYARKALGDDAQHK